MTAVTFFQSFSSSSPGTRSTFRFSHCSARVAPAATYMHTGDGSVCKSRYSLSFSFSLHPDPLLPLA